MTHDILRFEAFEERLEHLATRLTERRSRDAETGTAIATVESHLALTLNQLIAIRQQDDTLLRNLLEQECRIDGQLHQLRYRVWPTGVRIEEYNRLMDKLDVLAVERRRFVAQAHTRRRELQQQLLDLINQHSQLLPP